MTRVSLSVALVALVCACSSENAAAPMDAGARDARVASADAGPRACAMPCGAEMACVDGTCRPAAWSRVTSPVDSMLWGVWGQASNDVWAVGERGVILHYDGAAWTLATSPATSTLLDVWGTSASDVWVVGDPTSPSAVLHYDGTAWTGVVPYPTRATLGGISGSARDDVWAVGLEFGKGTILHFDGRAWTPITSTDFPVMAGLDIMGGLADVWSVSRDDAWAVGEAGVFHYDGMAWAPASPAPTTDLVHAMHASGASDVWIAAEARDTPTRTLFRFDGASWSSVVYPADGYVSDLWTAGRDDVWAVGEGPSGGIFHFDGTTWIAPASSAAATGLMAIWAVSPADIWSVGQDGAIWHFAPLPTR